MNEQIKTEYKYNSETKELTRITSHPIVKKGTDEELFSRETKDIFKKDQRDNHIIALRNEEEKSKQAKDFLKKQLAEIKVVEEDERLSKLREDLITLQKIDRRKETEDKLTQTEELLKRIRDENTKIKALVPESDRIK